MKTGRSSFLFLTMALASPTATWSIFSKALFSIEDAAIGVGLAICQSIIRAQGGRIQGSHRPNDGAYFRFSLPAPMVAGSIPALASSFARSIRKLPLR
jgi:hypothetical protein